MADAAKRVGPTSSSCATEARSAKPDDARPSSSDRLLLGVEHQTNCRKLRSPTACGQLKAAPLGVSCTDPGFEDSSGLESQYKPVYNDLSPGDATPTFLLDFAPCAADLSFRTATHSSQRKDSRMMGRSEFLTAIRDCPHDIEPRLLCQAYRRRQRPAAEFIHTQCDLETLSVRNPIRIDLETRTGTPGRPRRRMAALAGVDWAIPVGSWEMAISARRSRTRGSHPRLGPIRKVHRGAERKVTSPAACPALAGHHLDCRTTSFATSASNGVLASSQTAGGRNLGSAASAMPPSGARPVDADAGTLPVRQPRQPTRREDACRVRWLISRLERSAFASATAGGRAAGPRGDSGVTQAARPRSFACVPCPRLCMGMRGTVISIRIPERGDSLHAHAKPWA